MRMDEDEKPDNVAKKVAGPEGAPIDPAIELEKYRIRYGFYKLLLGTFALGIFTSLMTYIIKQQEINQKEQLQTHQLKIDDRKAEAAVRKLEQAHLGNFIKLALSEDIKVRVRFAHYFKSLTSSDKHRTRWEDYHKELVELRDRETGEISKHVAALQDELAKETKEQDPNKITELRSKIQKSFDELQAVPVVRVVGSKLKGGLGESGDGGAVKNLAGANLVGSQFSGADLRGVNLVGADLSRADLSLADLRGVRLQRANFTEADLMDADLRSANLTDANLRSAFLWDANLEGANLRRTNLRNGELDEANLRGANLQSADLTDANLSVADFEKAKNLTQEQLDSACISEGFPPKNLPKGLTSPTRICSD